MSGILEHNMLKNDRKSIRERMRKLSEYLKIKNDNWSSKERNYWSLIGKYKWKKINKDSY